MSVARRCFIYKAVNHKWYMELGNFEYAYDPADCTTYGPFLTQAGAEEELNDHSNPGGLDVDDSGQHPVPNQVMRPSASQRYRW